MPPGSACNRASKPRVLTRRADAHCPRDVGAVDQVGAGQQLPAGPGLTIAEDGQADVRGRGEVADRPLGRRVGTTPRLSMSTRVRTSRTLTPL